MKKEQTNKMLSLNKKAKGVYILVLNLIKKQRIKPGKLPETNFKAGIYLYLGRARNGLQGRLRHHMSKKKKKFWHIDYLLQKAEIKEIWIKHDFFGECQTVLEIRNLLEDSLFPLKKFGSSDCRCASHLIYINTDKIELTSLRNKLSFDKVYIHGNQA